MINTQYKKTLAFFTLLPPVKSGISEYSESLIVHLKKYFDIVVYIGDYKTSFKETIVKNFREFEGKEDFLIYNIGNHKNHKFMYRLIKKHQGIIILHDLNLFGFFLHLHNGFFRNIFLNYHLVKNHGLNAFIHCIFLNINTSINEKRYLTEIPKENSLIYGWNAQEKNDEMNFRQVRNKFAFQIRHKNIKKINIKLFTNRKAKLKIYLDGTTHNVILKPNSLQEITIPVFGKDKTRIFAELKLPTLFKIKQFTDSRNFAVRIIEINYETNKKIINFDIFKVPNLELIKGKFPERIENLAEKYPMFSEIVKNSKGAIVHTKYALKKIREKHKYKQIKFVHHGTKIITIEKTKKQIREELNLEKFSFIICSYGFIEKHKRINQTLEAFKKFLLYDKNSLFIMCGGLSREYNIQKKVTSLGIEKNVLITDFVKKDIVEKMIYASDICINLRYPTTGAFSGAIMKIFSLGKPCIISDVNEYKELPDDATWKIKPDYNEIKNIIDVLKKTRKNSKLLEEKSKNAIDFAKNQSWEKMASEINQFIGRVYR